jgi:heme/copper-type cytochrome/quinol oxidase subunit 3
MRYPDSIFHPTPEERLDLILRNAAKQQHPFHILRPSALPFLTGTLLFCWLVSQVFYLHNLPLPVFNTYRADFIHFSLLLLFITVIKWFLSVIEESSEGFHTLKVQQGLRIGILLFIASEVMFFFAFFWAFFHFSLVPSIALGNIWPPFGTQELSAWGLPLVNTLLLLTSGITITVAHAYISTCSDRETLWYLFLTVLLGVTFLFCQAYEYKYGVKFSWRDNIYGSIFFVTTGFHGLHVTIGTLFLAFCWIRHLLSADIVNWSALPVFSAYCTNLPISSCRFTPKQHIGFEAAAWYWHFVDVVWLFLFIAVYWWGGV